MAQEWTIDRVRFAPLRAAELLNAAEQQATVFNRRINDLIEANNRHEQAGRNWRIVEQLRADEGSSVEIVCDNRDFNGQPNNKVICVGDWTAWQDEIFTGDTIDEALGRALVAFKNWRRENG